MLVLLAVVALTLPNITVESTSRALADDKPEAKTAEATSPAEYYPQPSEAEKKIEAALNSRVTVEFNETPLADALDLLHKRTGVNLFLDKKGLAEDSVKRGEKMLLRAKEIPLKHVLRITLSQANLVFIVVDDVVMVTTRTEADSRLFARTYPVADLIHSPMGQDFASLIEMLTTTVDPTSWDENGGAASMKPNFDSNCLVVSQTYANQEQILSLLRSLRAAKQQAGGKADAVKK